MRIKITYEWCLEILDDGDIVDNHFEDKLEGIPKDELPNNDLVLCRVEGNENEGVTDTLWAYVKNNALPEYFTNAMGESIGIRVPKRFYKELENYLK